MPSTEVRILIVTIVVAVACALGVVSCISYLADGDAEDLQR